MKCLCRDGGVFGVFCDNDALVDDLDRNSVNKIQSLLFMSQRRPETRHFGVFNFRAPFFSPKQISDACFAQSHCDFLPFTFGSASSYFNTFPSDTCSHCPPAIEPPLLLPFASIPSILSLVGRFFLQSLPLLASSQRDTNFSRYTCTFPQADWNILSFSFLSSYSLAISTSSPDDTLEFDYATQNFRGAFQQTLSTSTINSSLNRNIPKHCISVSDKQYDGCSGQQMASSSQNSWKLQRFNVEEGNACSRHQQGFGNDSVGENQSVGLLDITPAVGASKHLLAGAVSAIVSRTLVAPLERIKLEYLIRGAKDDVLRTVQNIFKKEGVKGFWKGNLVNLIRTAPFKSLNFYAYDTFRKQMLLFSGKGEVSHLEKFAAGAAAGVTASIICFPMDTVRTRMVAPGGEALGNIINCFKCIIEKEGPLSLYAGLLPALFSMAPAGAVFYGVYDILKTSYLSSPKRKKDSRGKRSQTKFIESREKNASTDQLELGPMRTLLFGAIAGACAETITYPLEVIRRHLQLQDAAKRIGMIATAKGIVEKGGIGALYAGLLPSTVQDEKMMGGKERR